MSKGEGREEGAGASTSEGSVGLRQVCQGFQEVLGHSPPLEQSPDTCGRGEDTRGGSGVGQEGDAAPVMLSYWLGNHGKSGLSMSIMMDFRARQLG